MSVRQGACRRWLCSLDGDPASLLNRSARRLVHQYVADPYSNGSKGFAAYQRRLAAAMEYHWWRFCQTRFQPLDRVVALVQQGCLAYGRFDSDVLSEVALCEGVCQQDADAAARFVATYSEFIAASAYKAGGVRAEQDLEGFEAALVVPRGRQPPRLASFSGHAPLKNWLHRVVSNEWRQHARAGRRAYSEVLTQRIDPTPGPADRAQERECLDVLEPLFEQSSEVLDKDEMLLLRMVLLDRVPNRAVARLWGVHDSTITRARQQACRKLANRFRQLAAIQGQGSAYEDCLKWILQTSPNMLLDLAHSLAHRVRGEDVPA